MTRAIVHWFRRVLPPPGYLCAALVAGVLLEALWITLRQMVRRFDPEDIELILEPLLRARFVFVAALGLIYGVYRVWTFHPALRPAYFAWLQTTPWRSEKPLPLGPVRLVLQDACVIAALCAYAALESLPWSILYLPATFLAGYLTALAVVLWLTGQWWATAALLFGFGVAAWPWRNPILTLTAALACYVVGLLGLRDSLRAYPWEAWQQHRERKRLDAEALQLGWPYARLMPRIVEDGISYRDGFLVSLLAAWWSVVLFENAIAFGGETPMPVLTFLGALMFVAALARTLTYTLGYHPPIRLVGRLWTGRWIIPGYDKIAAAPLLALAWYCACAATAAYGPFPLSQDTTRAAMFLIPFGGLAILLNMGPTLADWRLTGHHRIMSYLPNTHAANSGGRKYTPS